MVEYLNEKFISDTKTDSSLIGYLSYVEKTEENRKKNNVSLNYDIRLKQKKSSEKENGNMNISLKISEIFPIKEDDLLKKIKNDIYLRESVKLFVDMINFKKT